jgi:hypothetical protein
MRGPRTNSGRALNVKWNIGAQHCLYHQFGKWYMPLKRFPGALCDPNGYVLFNTTQEYQDCTWLRSGVRVEVMGLISQMPEYKRMV